ncbi:hypothetical protein GVX81_01200 [[Haemophilus] felis]|uniref:DNA gyrase subunit B n=1 Tax=[Haemophilus] felis TaxID=123822 RepID=A0A1T0AZW1_9PAST|nr:hypothetical protein [[Haemophilus] felis]NBI40120.1 hypothetical protein [[Haemophilus] felis]OOS03493.1 hypothetical protein B0188_06520 [[Haemophilus] felis]
MARLFHLLINLSLTLASIAYPLAWLLGETLLGENHQQLSYLVVIMALLWAIKAIKAVGFQRFFATLMAILLSIIWFTRNLETMYWYPVIISTAMLILFGGSLFSSQSLIERLARLQNPNLPPEAIRYTRRVTQVWCGFFVLNIAICIVLILTEQYRWWALYSGGISYGLMGLLFVGEWVARKYFQQNR